jgi:hypothetical protein
VHAWTNTVNKSGAETEIWTTSRDKKTSSELKKISSSSTGRKSHEEKNGGDKKKIAAEIIRVQRETRSQIGRALAERENRKPKTNPDCSALLVDRNRDTAQAVDRILSTTRKQLRRQRKKI